MIYWWKNGKVNIGGRRGGSRPLALGLASAAMTIWVESSFVGAAGEEWELTRIERVLLAGRAAWFYVGKLAWPHPVMMFYPRWAIDAHVWWQFLFPIAAIALVVGLYLARGRIGRGPLAAVLIYGGVLLPTLGFFNVFLFRYSFVADHFQYHASLAILALAAAGAVMLMGRARQQPAWVAPLAAAGLLVPLALVARQKRASTTTWERSTEIRLH